MSIASMEARLRWIARAAAGRSLVSGWSITAAKAIAALLAILTIDAIRPLPSVVRLMIAGGWIGVLAFEVLRSVRRAQRGSPCVLAAARMVEDRTGVPHNRIVNALQLGRIAEPDDAGVSVRRVLAARIVERGSDRLAGAGIASVLAPESARARRAVRWLLASAALFIGAAAGVPRFISAGLPRFADPLGDHPPWSPTDFRIVFEPVEPCFGDDVRVRVTTGGRQPQSLRLIVRPEGEGVEPASIPMRADSGVTVKDIGAFSAVLRDLRVPMSVHAEGDTGRSRSVVVSPRLEPRIIEAMLRIVPPEYTRRPPVVRTIDVVSQAEQSITCITGSRIEARIIGSMGLRPEGVEISPGSAAAPRISSRGRTLTTEWVAGDIGRHEANIRPVGESGNDSRESLRVVINVVPDQPPVPRLTKPRWSGEELLAPAHAALRFSAEAADDFGLSVLGLAWCRLDAAGAWVGEGRAMRVRHDGPPVMLNDGGSLRFSPRIDLPDIGASPGDTLIISLLARDTRVLPYGEPQDAVIGPIVVRLAESNPSGSCSGRCEDWIEMPGEGESDSSRDAEGASTWSSDESERNSSGDTEQPSQAGGRLSSARWPSPSQGAGRDASRRSEDEHAAQGASGQSEQEEGKAGLIEVPPEVGADGPMRSRQGSERMWGRAASEAIRSDPDPMLRVPEGYRDVVTRYFGLLNRSPEESGRRERSP